jgi:hypothetical protein
MLAFVPRSGLLGSIKISSNLRPFSPNILFHLDLKSSIALTNSSYVLAGSLAIVNIESASFFISLKTLFGSSKPAALSLP